MSFRIVPYNFKTVPDIIEKLGYWKLCAHWVLKKFTNKPKLNQAASVQSFLKHFEEQSEEFLDSIVMGDET